MYTYKIIMLGAGFVLKQCRFFTRFCAKYEKLLEMTGLRPALKPAVGKKTQMLSSICFSVFLVRQILGEASFSLSKLFP